MSCYITSGIQLSCADSIGGLKSIWILGGSGNTITAINKDDIGQITGVTGSGTLYNFQLKRNTSSVTQTVTKNFTNGTVYFAQALKAVFYKYDQDKRNQVKFLSQNDAVKIIAEDQNGVYTFLGEVNGLYLSGGSAATGTAFGDRNGFELDWTGEEHEPMSVISGDLSTVFSGFNIA